MNTSYDGRQGVNTIAKMSNRESERVMREECVCDPVYVPAFLYVILEWLGFHCPESERTAPVPAVVWLVVPLLS